MSAADIEHTKLLARRSRWTTGLLTFFLPFAGYLYTRRRKLALITFIAWIALAAADDLYVGEDDVADTLLGFLMLGSAVENVVTVSRAKDKYRRLGAVEPQLEPSQDLSLQLLKTLQHRPQMTLADCVIATEGNIDEVRDTLRELERQDLIRSGNRDSDGAVVYTIV